MQSELHYRLTIEPAVFAALNQVQLDASKFGITTGELLRAVTSWTREKMENEIAKN